MSRLTWKNSMFFQCRVIMWLILLCNIFQIDAKEGTTPSSSHTEVNKLEKFYISTWKDLDTRPLPQWYDIAKIGIFIHWGVYSVPSYKNEWFWFMWKQGN